MRKGLFIIFGLTIMGVIVFFPPNLWSGIDEKQLFLFELSHTTENDDEMKLQTYELKLRKQKGIDYIDLDELQAKLPITAKIDDKNGQIELTTGKTKVSFLKDVSVMEKNGLFYPMKTPIVYQPKQILIPMETVARIFEGTTRVSHGVVQLSVKQSHSSPSVQTASQKMSADKLIAYLDFLQNPIKGAHISTQNSSLPGAPRTYRKGVHEGIDWYGGQTTGVPITKNTPVYSIADGIVVRADHDYQEMTTAQRQKLLALGRDNNGQTPQYVLDKLRGRSVWIQHEKGVLARYVHLERIPKQLKVGQKVKAGDLIGFVGNSGTSDGAKGNNEGIHLHLDLFIYGKWVWDQYTMKETRRILEEVFSPSESP